MKHIPPPTQLVDRETAHKNYSTYFFTGKACSRGHVDWRYVSSGNCVQCSMPYRKKAKTHDDQELIFKIRAHSGNTYTAVEVMHINEHIQRFFDSLMAAHGRLVPSVLPDKIKVAPVVKQPPKLPTTRKHELHAEPLYEDQEDDDGPTTC